jgi:hypothetical protein
MHLKVYLSRLTIPLQYAANFSHINRMIDNIETGRAKSIKEAVSLDITYKNMISVLYG